MKKPLFFSSIIVFISTTILTVLTGPSKVLAQKNGESDHYKTWIKVYHSNKKELGYLYQVKDSSLLITNGFKIAPLPGVESQFNEISYAAINTLKIRKNGAKGKGAGIGALIGLGVGIAGGLLAKANERSTGIGYDEGVGMVYIAYFSTFLVPAGALVGFTIGSSKKSMRFKNNPTYIRRNRNLLAKYAIQK